MKLSLGIMAYNEAANMADLLDAVLGQQLNEAEITEIYVVSSASTDGTDDIVRGYSQRDSRIRLIVQEQKMGKAAAINEYLKVAAGDILIVESGDTLPLEDTFANLIKPFAAQGVGMTGAHPVPLNKEEGLLGFTVHFLWRLHHRLNLEQPKLGELIAFRPLLRELPTDTAVDEAWIEGRIRELGYWPAYAADALVYNKGAETIADFWVQRRRIYCGHIHLKKTLGYEVSSFKTSSTLKLAWEEVREHQDPLPYVLGAALLELTGRLLGWFDFHIRKKNPYSWDVAESTKDLHP